jgi:hypothetical protein
MSGYGTFSPYTEVPPLPTKWPASYVPYKIPVPTAPDDPLVADGTLDQAIRPG